MKLWLLIKIYLNSLNFSHLWTTVSLGKKNVVIWSVSVREAYMLGILVMITKYVYVDLCYNYGRYLG